MLRNQKLPTAVMVPAVTPTVTLPLRPVTRYDSYRTNPIHDGRRLCTIQTRRRGSIRSEQIPR